MIAGRGSYKLTCHPNTIGTWFEVRGEGRISVWSSSSRTRDLLHICIFLLAYFPCFEKINGGSWDHLAVSMSVFPPLKNVFVFCVVRVISGRHLRSLCCLCISPLIFSFSMVLVVSKESGGLVLPRTSYLFIFYLITLSGSQTIASNGTMIHEWWIGKDVEGSGRSLFKDIIMAFAWEDERNHE
jgi:hypothetical protein